MSADKKLADVHELVGHVAQQLRPPFPEASDVGLLGMGLRHLIAHVEGNVNVRDEERAEYWYLKAYLRRLEQGADQQNTREQAVP